MIDYQAICTRLAHQLVDSFPLPVCTGCPSGQFEENVRTWGDALAALMFKETGYSWSVVQRDVSDLELKIAGHDAFVLVGMIAYSSLGRTLKLWNGGPGSAVDEPITEPDRIGDIVTRLEALAGDVKDLREQVRVRDIAHLERVQRLMLLVHHFGQAPWEGTIEGLVGDRKVTLRRPMPTLPA